jgi:hypothetical protein
MLFLVVAAALAAAPCDGHVEVRGPGLPTDVVEDFAADARSALVDVRAWLGSSRCEPLAVTLVPAMADAPVLDPPWHLPSWAAGAAEPAARRIVVGVTVDGAVQDRRRTLRHELAHVVAAEIAGEGRLPRWLDEGIARVVAGEHGIGDLAVLSRAHVAGRALPLPALARGFPPGAADAALAYATAGRAVALLEGRADRALPRVLARIAAGATVDDALVDVAGRATWQLDRDVVRSVDGLTALATLGVETDVAMALCAGVVAVAGVRARRRLRTRIAAMADDDPTTPAVRVVRFRLGPAADRLDVGPPAGRVLTPTT